MSKLTKLLIGIAIADFLSAIDSTSVSVAMPKISQFFHLTPSAVSWIQTLYIFALIIVLIPAGKIGDIKGHKKNFITGLWLFAISSLLIIFSPNYIALLVLRVVQGTAAAILYTSGNALVAHNWKNTEAAFGMTAAFFSLGLLFGPIIGGIFSDLSIGSWTGWHLIFAINIPFALISAILISKNCNETEKSKQSANFDYLGIIFLILLLGSLILKLTQPNISSLILVISLFSLMSLIIYEKKKQDPLIRLEIFQNQTFASISIFTFIFMMAIISLSYINTFYLQDVVGKTATQTGLMMLPIFVGMSVFAMIAGMFRNWKVSAILASMLLIIGMFVLNKVDPSVSYFKGLFWGYLLTAAGSGLMMTNTFAAALGSVQKQFSGLASGYINTVQQIGSLIGISFIAGQNIIIDYQKLYLYLLFIAIIALIASLFIKNKKVA